MTPKEQAIELINKFLYIDDTDYQIENGCGITLYQVKQCALITINEIQEAIRYLDDQDSEFYWLEVKQEIEKL